jgi:hypothetical protein
MGHNWKDKYIIASSKKDLFSGMGIWFVWTQTLNGG